MKIVFQPRKIIHVLEYLKEDWSFRKQKFWAILPSLVVEQKNVTMLDIETASRSLRRKNNISIDWLQELVAQQTEREGPYLYVESVRHLGSGAGDDPTILSKTNRNFIRRLMEFQ